MNAEVNDHKQNEKVNIDQKIRRLILCLYGIAAMEVGHILYQLTWKIRLLESTEIDLKFIGYDYFSASVVTSLCLLYLIFRVVMGLKEKRSWSWIGTMVACVLSTPGLSIPFALYGMYILFDKEVREHFIKDLEEKLKI